MIRPKVWQPHYCLSLSLRLLGLLLSLAIMTALPEASDLVSPITSTIHHKPEHC